MVCSSVISDFPLRPLGLCRRLKGFKNAHRRRHRPGTGTISSRRPARLPSPAEPARQGRERRAGNELIGPVALLRVSAHGRPFPPAAATCGGGRGPPGSGVALAHSGSPGSRAEGDVAVRPGQANLCSNRGRRAAPFWTQRVTAARLPRARLFGKGNQWDPRPCTRGRETSLRSCLFHRLRRGRPEP